MTRIIAVTNQKGGVGKTTTSVNLAAALGLNNKNVLLIDLDPQGNATSGLGIDKDAINECMQNVITDETKITDVIQRSKNDNVDVAPATINLAGADILLMDRDGKHNILKEKISGIKNNYDFIIIDCPPSLGILNQLALTAADSVLIPIQAQHYALEGIKQLFTTIQLVQRLYNKSLAIEGILLTMYDGRNNLSREVREIVVDNFKEKAYRTYIPQNIKLAEAPQFGKSIFQYDNSASGADAYRSLATEVIENGN
jgi:chromosome partitioning protein